MNRYDVIIVGAGLGGLTAGAKLARDGKKVILIEQHNIVGGCSTHFARKRTMDFEVGLHEINGVYEPRKQAMFKDTDVWDRVEFVRVPEFYRVIKGNDLDVVVPDNIEGAKASLKAAFPNEHEAINTYFKDITTIRTQINRYRWGSAKKLLTIPFSPFLYSKLLKYRKSTVGEYLDNLTNNEYLKIAIIANIGYYSEDPYNLNFVYFASGQGSYMGDGGWFVKNGSQKLSDAFADVITENGGDILLKHMVNEIIVENGKAIGVRFIRKNRPEAKEQVVYGDYIIANASMPMVINKLIPSLQDSPVRKQLNKLEPGCSLMTIYLSFKEPISKYVNGHYSTFVYDSQLESIKEFGELEKSGDYYRKGFVFVNYHSFDSGMNSDSSYTGVICGVDYLKNWDCLSKEDYKAKKQKVISIYTERLNKQFPGIADHIEYAEMSTPKTIQKYTMNDYGTVYGYAQTRNQSLTNKAKKYDLGIDNLYFASAWVFSGGFSAAMSTGYSCAKAVLRKMEMNS